MSEPVTRTPDVDERSSAPDADVVPAFRAPRRACAWRARCRPTSDHMEVRRDVRARRPSVIGALVNARALERALRVVSLLALDLGALWARSSVRCRQGAGPGALRLRRGAANGARLPAVRVPGHRAAVRAQRPLLLARGAPRFHRDRLGAGPGGRVVRVRGRQRARLQLLLHLLRRALLRSDLGGAACAGSTSRSPASRCARSDAAGGRSWSARASRSTRSRMRCRRLVPHPLRARRLHLADAAARQRPAQPRPAGGAAAPARRARGSGGDHRRPRLPAAGGVRARGPLPRARRRGADRPHDHGDPDPPRTSWSPGSRCRCSSSSRRYSRASTS